ncbi:hypothetical protein [Kitasatospora sp. NBC_00315]|uniref:LppU/SCO3897 family protein n=1 Tax=Kitasatospora sp. NBC_00315 TaxID=2975963 RepID=UPI00324FC751
MSTPPPQAPFDTPPAGPNPYAAPPAGAPGQDAFGTPQGFGAPQRFGAPPAGAPTPGVYGDAPHGYGGVPQGYGAPQAFGGPQAFGNPQAFAGPSCRFCGSVPAVQATVRGHQGFVIIMRFLKLQGPFCRSCGIAAHRRMTADSLWQGWWGIGSAFINPITMLINLPQRAKINKLAPPLPGAPGLPADPGKPVFRRPAILGLLIPLIVVGAIVYSAQRDPGYASVGDCVHSKHTVVAGVEDKDADVVVIDCSDSDADARIVGKVPGTHDGESACTAFSDADGYYYREQGSDQYTLCLHFLK